MTVTQAIRLLFHDGPATSKISVLQASSTAAIDCRLIISMVGELQAFAEAVRLEKTALEGDRVLCAPIDLRIIVLRMLLVSFN